LFLKENCVINRPAAHAGQKMKAAKIIESKIRHARDEGA